MIGLIIFIAIVVILIILFISWLFTMKANGKCPLCALKKITMPRKITMDISETPDYDNGVAKTPPMGWSSWNTFRNHIDQELIMEIADAMVDSGLADAGYKYLNLDDCWQSSMRDSDGKLQGDLRTFSRGIPQLIKDINERGLKVGLYSSNGTLTCEDMPASLGNETLDAKTLASWGCEFFKYDFCHKEAISGDCPAIEKIEINILEQDGENPVDLLVLEPEDAEFTGRAKVIKLSDVPSGKAIGFINHGAGSATFRVITLPEGKYALTIVHQKTFRRRDSYAQVTVNGKVYEVFFPRGKGFSDTGRTQIVVDLKDGENIITIQNPVVTLADSSYIQYKRMGEALQKATKDWAEFTDTEEKPIVYSICEWGTARPWDWGGKAGNMWRTTHDIFPAWGSMASPLMLGNDIRKFVDGNNNAVEGNATLKIVTNKALIAIDQDTLGKPAKRIKKSISVDILARPLANGDVALCIFNKSASSKNVHFDLNDLLNDEYINMQKSEQYELHDLWNDERNTANAVSVSLPKHSVIVYRIKSL